MLEDVSEAKEKKASIMKTHTRSTWRGIKTVWDLPK